MVPVFMLFYSWYRSLNDQEEDVSRTRRRMVGDDVDIDEIVDEERFSEATWSASGHPVIARRLNDLSVKVGARARFLVEVSSPTPVSVRWEKDGRTVDESDRIQMVAEGNFHCLDISPVCQEDGGLWRVKVTNMVGTAISSAQLTLLVPKAYKKPEFVEPLRAVLTAQGTVSLECKVIGVPTPLLRWFKGANEIKAGDVLALTPNAADPTSLGTYTCLAANCMGTAESTSVVHIDGTPATVQGFLPTGPKPIFAKELRNEKVKLGGSITLECKVTVPPWPEAVNWYGPKGEVAESGRAHVMEDGAGAYSLKIAAVTAEDNGTWKCVATNKHGAKAMSTCLISVNYPKNYRKPKFLESLKAVLTEEGLVSFECKVVGYPTPNLSWFKDGQELKPGDVYQLTGTNSLGSYCCIARNCMGEAQSSAELTLEDIKSQLSEEEKIQLSSEKLPPRFVNGLKSVEAKINEILRLSVKVSVFPEPSVMWFRDDEVVEDGDRYKIEKDKLGVYHMNINKLEFCDQAEWKCVATNDYGQSVTSSFVKLNIPKHYKKPKFLEDLKAVMSEEGAVNLECKVIGVPQPKLKWFKDGKELKPGDIHKIISGQDGTCCLGTYTCLAQNCMGSVSSSASLLGFEEKGEKSTGVIPDANRNGQVLSRDRSLSTIHEERTSQLHDTDKSTTIDDRAEEVSFSFDGKEVSVSLYETPDLTEEEALQIVEMYADQISEHVTEQNVVELPPMRFTKESSTSGKLLMEAVVIDVSPEYFSSTPAPRKAPTQEDDLRTDNDVDEFSLVEELNTANLSPDRNLSPVENLTLDKITADFAEKTPSKPPRSKVKSPPADDKSVTKEKKVDDKTPTPKRRSKIKSADSEKEDDSLQEFEKRKTQSVKLTERKKAESELEDDSLYEFESRKTTTTKDEFKSLKEDEHRYSTETGVARTPDESQYFSPVKSPLSVASKMTEDEATFDTAEDSAFDKSEMSVLETLAHSLHEIQKNLTAVEAHVSDSSTGDMQSAQGISEFIAEPLAEVQKSLELVEAQIQEFPSGKYSSDVLETLVQPITKFKKNLAMLEEKGLPSILESVAKPLEELNREISYIQQATQSQIEYSKSVEQVQESLTKIIERQASVPSDRKMLDTISSELQKLEEKANDDLETYYDRLLTVGSELRSKANDEQDQEIQDILKAVGDLVKPLKRLTAVTSKSIAAIIEDNQLGNIPSKKILDSLLKPLDALDASLSLLESVGMLKSHRAIRGAGIPILYKVSVPMDELETTIKLVENLSAHSAVEFLIPPLDNLIKVVSDIDVSTGGDGFLEDLQGEGTPIVKNLDDSLDIMLNCIHSIDKGVAVVDSERGIPSKLPALLKPMEDLQKSLKSVEKGIASSDIGYEDVHAIAQEISKPMQSIRSEFAILQHEIEADHYSSEPNPSQTALSTLVGPLESVQNCISSFHETVMCKSADDPMHLRFVLYALKELTEPLSSLTGKMIKTEEILLGKGDPYQGLKAVARSVSELRESSSAVTSDSNVIEQISNILSKPLSRVQTGLEDILSFVDKKDKHDLNKDLLKSMDEPFKELQCALLEIEGNVHENVTEGVTPELRQAVQELQRSILVIQDQSSFEYGDEPSTIEANIDTLQALTQPLQTLRAQFTEVQRSANRTLIKADRALNSLKDSTRRVSVTITDLKSSSKTSVSNILNALGAAIGELEAAVEEANSHLGRGKRVDETRHVLANSLKVASGKLGEVVSKADDMSVSLEPSKRRSLVLVQDFIHNLKSAIEQSTRVIDCDKGTAVDRSRDTLIAIEQLASAVSGFHEQLRSVDEFTSSASAPQGMNAMKEQVDKIQANIEQALSVNVADKNDKMILETIENDVKSVQRVLDNLLAEDASDGARVRFILAKAESIHSDLKDMVKSADPPATLKTACQAALTVMDLGESLLNRKSPMRMEIVTQVENEPEVSVIGELLETLDELERTFNRLKREAKIRAADTEVAEMAMEIATLQALVQDCATQASGELLDKAVEVCIPIKAIEVKLTQTANLTKSDLEETSVSLHNINQVLNAAIRKKEAEKLMQPSTSIIGELLEKVGDLETCFDRLKRIPLPNDTTESEVNDVGREILALQNIVDDLTSEATGDLLDKAQDICIPMKAVESTLKHHAVLTKVSICEAKDKLKIMNEELLKAIAQNEVDKEKREKEFEKLFSSESLSSSVDVPIVRSIVTTIEYMQAHLNSLIVPRELTDMKNFLERFECSLVRYGERLAYGKNDAELKESLSELEDALKTADVSRIEVRKLVKAVEGLKSSQGEMSKALPALQSILSPLKTLHEELSRPNSPKRLKKAELKYLESFSKSSTDLELGLMKMEKAVVTGTKLEVDCMATPVEQLASFIDGIAHEPSLKNLDEESSIHALKSLAQPINAIQTIVAQVQEAVSKHNDSKAAELLNAVAKPVRELRTNIALIQDQAMMNCSISQLDELKQAVALMTQVGTETPALKQPLLQLQAKLQALEPEAELNEVVSELTAPVDALKQAVSVLETKGENSMLLELCHQVVEIINRSDDTLSEMTSIGGHSTRADALPGDALLKAATLCHELMEDQSLSEMSHTDDTLTPTHAAEHLPSIHAAHAEQRVVLEQVDSLKDVSVTVHEAAAVGSVAGQLKAALQVHDVMEDQTLSELSELDNSVTIAAEMLPSIRNTVAGEQKMALEQVESFDKSLQTPTEAVAKGVPKEHMKIATTELNVLEDQTLSDLSPIEMSETMPLEKLTSLRGTVAAEEKLLLEEAHSLDRNKAGTEQSISLAEAELKQVSISGQIKAGKAGLDVMDEHTLSDLSMSDGVSAAVGSPKIGDTNQAALAEQNVAFEQAGALSDDSLSLKEASIKDVSDKQSAAVKTHEVLQGPTELAVVESLLQKDVNSIEDLRNIITIMLRVSVPIKIKEQLAVLNAFLATKSGDLEKIIPPLHAPLEALDKAAQSEAKSESSDACLKIVKVLKTKEEALLERIDSKSNDAAQLLQGKEQDVLKLKKAVAVLSELPAMRELSVDSVQKAIMALNSEIENLSPLAKPEEILQETKAPISMLKQAISKLETAESPVLALCRKVVAHVELGKDIMQNEAVALLKDDGQEVTKLKKAVAIVVAIPKEEKATILEKPLVVLKEILDQVGPLAKPEDVLTLTAEPINALKASISEVEKSGENPQVLEVAKLIVEKTEKNKTVVQEEVIKLLKQQKSSSDLKKAVSVVAYISKGNVEVYEPFKALQAELEKLTGATPEEILKCTLKPVESLKQVVVDLKRCGEKSQLLEICELVVQTAQQGKQAMQKEVTELLKREQNVTTMQKAVAKLIDIPIEKTQDVKITPSLQALRAKLDVMSPKATAIEILRGTLEPVKQLKIAVSDLKKSGEKSQILDICEALIENAEKGKGEMEKEASQLLQEARDVPKLQKAVAILVDIPKDSAQKVSLLNVPLVALQAQLEQLGPGATPGEVVKCTLEPIRVLKQVVTDIKLRGETSQLVDICQLVIDQAEQSKTALQQDAVTSLKADKTVAGLQKAVALLIDIPKEDGQKVQKLDTPLISLQAKLEKMKPDTEPVEILRGTIEPVKELKQVIADMTKSGEKSQLLEICNMVIERAEEGREAMQEEAAKLLTAEKQDVSKLQKAVAILVDLPKEEARKMSVVKNSLAALQAKLDTLPPTAKPEEVLRCTIEPVKALKQAISDVKVKGEKARLLDICELVVNTAEQGKMAIQDEVVTILKAEVDASTLKKAVAMLIEIPKGEGEKVQVINKPLVSLQSKLEQMGPAVQAIDILKGTMEPVNELKKVVSDLKKSGNKSQLVEICELVIEKVEEGKKTVQKEAARLLQGEISDASKLKKAVAILVDAHKDESQSIKVCEPLAALHSKLEKLEGSCKPQEILRCSLEPVKALEKAISDVSKAGEKSELADVCSLIVEKVEQCKDFVEKEAKQLLEGPECDVRKLQKAVAILVDIPKDSAQKVSRLNVPLVALQAQLEQLGPGATPGEIVKSTLEPIRALKQVVTDIKLKGETSQLVDICQLVIDQAEQSKTALQQDAVTSLKADKTVAGIQKAVALLIDIPKEDGQKVQKLDTPLISLQAKLEKMKPDTEPVEILRGTIEPVKELKQVIADMTKSGEKSQLLEICNMVIERAEEGREAMQEEAAKLLTAEKQDVSKIQKAVAILVDLPKEEARKMSVVKNSLAALQAKLDTLPPTAKPEEVLRCTIEPVKALKQAISDVKVKGEKARLLDICELVVNTAEQGKMAIQDEVVTILKAEVDASTLKKAVAMLIEIPKGEGEKVQVINKPLVSLQSKLEQMGPAVQAIDILKGTMEPVNELKKVVSDLKKSGNKSQLVEICELVIEKVEEGKKAVQKEAARLLQGEISDASKLKKAVAILVDAPKDEIQSIKVCEPLAALHSKLEKLEGSCKPQEILRCSLEPVKALEKAIADVSKAGEKSELADVCSLIVEKVEQCKDFVEKEAKQLLEGPECDVRKLKKAVSIVVDVSGINEQQKAVNESLIALQSKLLDLSPSSKPEDILRVTSQPIKSLKAKITNLKTNGQQSATLEICQTIIEKVELGKDGMQKEAAELIVGELKDVSKLKRAIDLLVDIPKEDNEEAPLTALKVKLQKLGPKAKPEEVFKETVEPVQALKQVVTKLEASGAQTALLEICKDVVRHIESGKEKEKTLKDAQNMIDAGVYTIAQLVEVSIVLSRFSKECDALTKPVGDLNSRLDLLYKGSKIEDFLPDLIEPVKSLKKSVSSLEKVDQNEMAKVTVSLVNHLEPIFQLDKLELQEAQKAEEKKLKAEQERKKAEEKEKAAERAEREKELKKAEEEKQRKEKEQKEAELKKAEEEKQKKAEKDNIQKKQMDEKEAAMKKSEIDKLKADKIEQEKAQKAAAEKQKEEKELKKAEEEKQRKEKEQKEAALKKAEEEKQNKAEKDNIQKKQIDEKEAALKKSEIDKLKADKIEQEKAQKAAAEKQKEEEELKKAEEEKQRKEKEQKEAALKKAEEEKQKKAEKDNIQKKQIDEKEAALKKSEIDKLKADKIEQEKAQKAAAEKQKEEKELKKAEEEKQRKEKEQKEAALKKAEEEKQNKAEKDNIQKKQIDEKEAALKKSEIDKLKADKIEQEKAQKAAAEKQKEEKELKKADEEKQRKEKEQKEAALKKAEEEKQNKAEKESIQKKQIDEKEAALKKSEIDKLKADKIEQEKAQKAAAEKQKEEKEATLKKANEKKAEKDQQKKPLKKTEANKLKAEEEKPELTAEEKEKLAAEEKEKAEKDKRAREKQQSLTVVEDMLVSGILTISHLKKAVGIMSVYKKVCKTLDEPLESLSLVIETLYEKSEVSDFVPDLIKPMMKLKRAADSAGSAESGLLSVCMKLLDHLEPVLHLKAIDQEEKKREEVEKLKRQKEEKEARAKEEKCKEEELEKERIDAELRKAKAEAEKQKLEEESRKKQLKEEQMRAEKQKEIAEKVQKKEPENVGEKKEEQQIQTVSQETASKDKIESPKVQDVVEVKQRTVEPKVQPKDKAISKEEKIADHSEARKKKAQSAKEDAERRENELKEARENERKLREEKQLRLQQEREKQEQEDRVRREKEKAERDIKKEEERKKLDKEKEEVEQRERNIKAKLEQVKREKRELEMEEQNKMIQARKLEKERQEQEEIARKANEEARQRIQQEKEQELRKQRLKELERREADLDSMKSRESLRKAHLDDLHKKEVAKGISKSLDAVYLSSAEKINRGIEYSASVATMTSARDTGVHSSRGISVVELMDYQPAPVRPERTKKLERDMNREAQLSKWDSRLRESDMRSRPRERTTHATYTPPTYDSNQDVSTYSWDRSKEQSWKHLEYPTPDYEGPPGYRSRRSVSPIRDFGSTSSLGGTRYQPAPQQNGSYQRRRSMSPLERSIIQPYTGSTVSLTSLGSRKHIDELTSARLRPATPTRSYVPTRSRSIPKQDHRAYIVNGLVDKTVIHGGKIRLSCNIGGDPNPSIEWMKDGKSIAYHTEASRYKTECNYGVACLEVEGARLSDAGQYTCVVKNVEHQTATTCTVRVALNDDDDKEWESIENELEANMPREVCLSVKGSMFGMPRVTGMVADPVVPSGGTIAVHVQVAGCHRPEVTWLHGGAPLPKYSPRVHYFEDGGLFTLLLEGATPAESGVYTCRVSGRGRGAVDTTTTVQVVERRGHEKPAIFTARPDTRLTLTAGDDMTLTCYVGGDPRPQVTLMKGIKDVTTSCRTLKEVFGEYVRLTLKRVTLEDRGTFFIMAKNIYGTDRTFVTLDVRERAKSLTPPSWSERTTSLTSIFKEVHHQSSPHWRSAASLHSSFTSLYE